MTWSLAAKDVPSLQEEECGMVEVPPPPVTACWRKSSTSGDPEGECLEVSRAHERVWVRDSKNLPGPVLGFTREGWAAFIVGVRRGEFDRSGVPA